MASTYTPTQHEKPTEPLAVVPSPPPMRHFAVADVVLRFLLFAAALAAVLVMVTSKQTKMIPVPVPPFQVPRKAKFQYSPAFIYFVAAFSVAGFYAIITTLLSWFALLKPGSHPKLVSHFAIFDVLLLGIAAAATGAAGGVAYIGLKGNSHTQWAKICNVFNDYCKHIGASLAVSVFGCGVLALLVLLQIYSLSKRIPK